MQPDTHPDRTQDTATFNAVENTVASSTDDAVPPSYTFSAPLSGASLHTRQAPTTPDVPKQDTPGVGLVSGEQHVTDVAGGLSSTYSQVSVHVHLKLMIPF